MKRTLLSLALCAAMMAAAPAAVVSSSPPPLPAQAKTASATLTAINNSSTVSGIPANSLVQAIAPSGGWLTVSIDPGTAWTGSAHFWISADGVNLTQSSPDILIYRESTGTYGAIPSGASGNFRIPISAGVGYFGAGTLGSGNIKVNNLGVSPFVPLGAQRTGKALTLLGAPSGSASGLVATGAHTFSHYWGDNFSGTTLYLQFFDATSLPGNGTAAIAQVVVPFGIGTAPSEIPRSFGEDWIQVVTGLYYAWSTTSGTLTLVGSGSGLGFEVYGG